MTRDRGRGAHTEDGLEHSRPSGPKVQLPEMSRRRDNVVGIEANRVTDVVSTDYPGHRFGADESWSIDEFRRRLRIDVVSLNELDMETDVIGIDASIANAFRRIMIAEVPTMAIEYVYVQNNTSVIQDEVLAHRLGLLPLNADPDRFSMFSRPVDGQEPVHLPTDTIVFKLLKRCERNTDADSDEVDPTKLYVNAHVYSRDLEWIAHPPQDEWFVDRPIAVVQPDILVAKLRPGQEIDLTMHAVLGVGQDHAKFSPVAIASYRLLPTIEILKPIEGKDAERFKKCFLDGVIEIVDNKAVVKDTRKDMVTREVLRHDEFKNKVKLGRIRDHFIFNIESTGCMPPDTVFLKSVRIFKEKCLIVKQALQVRATTDTEV